MHRFAHFKALMLGALALAGCESQVDPPPPRVISECLSYYSEHRHPFTPSEFPVEVVIDTRVDNDRIALILDGVDMWNDQLGSEALFVTITSDLYGMHGDCNFATLTTKEMLPGINAGLTSFGQCAASHVDILTDMALTDIQILNIAAHELGHVLGAPHDDDDPLSVMYPKLQAFAGYISERSFCHVRIAMDASDIE